MRICEDIIVDYDEDGYPIYEQQCYDDGTTDTSSASDADIAAGLNADTGQLDFSKMYDWNANADGSKQKVNADGSVDYQDPDGSTYTVKNGIYTTQSEGKTWNFDSKQNGFVDENGNLIKDAPSNLFSKMLNAIKANPVAALGTAYAALKSFGGKDEGGYNVPVPKLDAITQQIQYNDPNRRPGSAGRQYTTDPRFVKQGDAASLAAAQAASDAQAQGILAAYKPAAAPPKVNPYAGQMTRKYNDPPTVTAGTTTGTTTAATPPANTGIAAALPVMPTQQQLMDPNYKINSIGMADGGIAMAKGRYLQGGTDGMADKISTTIDGNQEAALSHGEFVIPADVVSHLGNGNSDAGAKKLYAMMDRIREARTGTKEQGKKINPDKFLAAASGGLASSAYAKGGEVMGFIEGGGVPLDTSKTSTLSPWAGDYVTNMLGQTQALTNAPMQTYGGPLTAGASDLQQQGFAGISEVAKGGFNPTTFTNQYKAPTAYSPTTSSFDTAAASQYMNPYLSAALQPQIDEARRQSQITQQGNAAKMTQAGAFGGSRGAIMDAETQRSLGANLAGITGAGYNKAYDAATAQFNADQARKMAEAQYGATQGMTSAQNTAQYGDAAQKATEASRQYSADFGLKSLNDLMSAGAAQRGIEGEGIAADKRQFEEQQARPYTNLEFQRKMLEGLPIGAETKSTDQDALSKVQTDISGLASLYQKLANLKLG
jgi:hypothetical protein